MEISFVQDLLAQLEGDLQQIRQVNADPGNWAKESILILQKFLAELRDYIQAYPFKRHSDEILFYRKVRMPVMSKLIFYTGVFNLWTGRCLENDYHRQRKYWVDK